MWSAAIRGAEVQKLHGHVPAISAGLQSTGRVAPTNRLDLVISLPLRNKEALTNLLRDIYDPASTNFRHYLTPREFTARFGPTENDFNAVIDFARANGFTVTATHPNRVLVDVNASVADIEKAFHLELHNYRHPSENRTCFGPDVEPSLALAVPVAHIGGLDNFSQSEPLVKRTPASAQPRTSPMTGSGIDGSYAGYDFRAAYLPDTTLTGAGQSIAMVEFDGYTLADITNYEAAHGLPNVTLTNVLLDGFSGMPSGNGGEIEVSLDIETAIAMAPGATSIIVYEVPPNGSWHDMLSRIANDNLAQQISCSWFMQNSPADPVADGIFQQMALQGQSFFNGSGDSNAYTGLIPFPCDSPYITQVGGTVLTTTGPVGARVSETVLNRGNGFGSSGGISTQYTIPYYQTNVSMAFNQGSTSMHNVPDVALAGESVEVVANGINRAVGGTSCAAPLWAGIAAMVNQQASANHRPALGFANPAIYAIGASPAYALCFNDITTGNNFSPTSPTKFYATNGYDLCTGWGTPAGQQLINVLANPDPLLIRPALGFAAAGRVGGPFTTNSQSLTLTNSGTNALTWTLTNPAPWLNVSPVSGSLVPGGPATIVTVSLNAAASNLSLGSYSTTIWFTNLADNVGQSYQYSVFVLNPPVITSQPSNLTILDGQTAIFSVAAAGDAPLIYQWQLNGTNLTNAVGISGITNNILTISNASVAGAGAYTLVVTNAAGVAVSSNAVLSFTPSAPVITLQPTGQSTYAGFTVQLSVAALGTKPFYYQWTLNGTNLGGATNVSLTLPNAQVNQSGAYAIVISNSLNSTLSSNALVTINPIPPCVSPISGLVSWWKAEGNVLDSAGTNNGTLAGGVTYVPGVVGQAFAFSGTNSGVRLGNPANMKLQDFSAEMWVQRVGSTIAPKGMDEFMLGGGGASWGFGMRSDGRLFLTKIDVSGVTNSIAVTDTNWHHVAVTKGGANVVFYVDGVASPSPPYNPGFAFFSGVFAVGARGDLFSCFVGSIDEAAFYNRPLTAAEIQLIYMVGAGGKCSYSPPGTYAIQLQNGGSILLTFNGGIPNRVYRIQCSDSVVSANWQDLGSQTTDQFGAFQFTDGSPATNHTRYYRAISP